MIRPTTPGGAVAPRTPPTNSTARRERTGSRLNKSFLTSMLALSIFLACTADSSVTSLTTDDPQPTDQSDAPMSIDDAQIVPVSGDGQEGLVASYLAEPLAVQIVDSTGAPFPDAPVEWVFYQGAGKLGTEQPARRISTYTDADGNASVRWQMGTRSGVQSASVEIASPAPAPTTSEPSLAPDNNNGKKVGFEANAKPGDIESVSVSPSLATLAVADSLQMTATAIDQFGNPIEGLVYQWKTSDETITEVSDAGMAYAMAVGGSTVTAKYKSVEGTGSLTNTDGSDPLPPTASIVEPYDNTTVVLGDSVRFRGDASDSDGEVVSHRWNFGDGSSASVQEPGPYVYSTEGTHTVTYDVTDDQGMVSGTDTSTVTVASELNAPPLASIVSPSQDTTVTLGDAVAFQGSSGDEDGSVVTHSWSFGDGNTASVEDPGAYTYEATGNYTVSYQVTDDDGTVSSPQSVVITVSSSSPPSALSPTVEWNMDWSDATGTSRAAVWDSAQAQPMTGGWNDFSPDPVTDGLQVVDTASAHCDYSNLANGGPANVLQTPHGAGGTMGFTPSDGYLSTPAVGEARYYRMLVCLRWTGGEQTLHDISDDGGNPPLQYNGNANLSPGLETESSHWQITLWYTDTGSTDQFEYSSFKLQKPLSLDTPYWLEWSTHIVSLSPDSIHAHVRVTNAVTGVVEADDDDFLSVKESLGMTLADSTAIATVNSIVSVNGFQFGGANGWDNAGSGVHHEYGAVAICSGTWCGTTYPLPGEN